MWTSVFVSGIVLGSFYTLISLGFALIFGATHTFNLAHGELLVLAGYVAYWLWKAFGLSLLFTFPAAVVVALLLCFVLQRLFSLLSEPRELNSIVVSFGIAILLQNGMLFCFSGDYRLIRVPVLNQGFHLHQIYLSYGQVALLALSLLVIALLYLLMRHTYVGKALRATIQDREAASLAGINVSGMGVVAFGIGAVLIGLAGPLYGCIHYLYPTAGPQATLLAITITIFAGIGRLRGLILGGWVLGLAESATVFLWGASWRELVSTIILLTVLALRPHGILGRDER
ncbi:MAG: branched-chain amino acid ABC transporter permease [Deltaproteobacteria bacterium]|nr:MAG: branched-chain amino acid ABC transporter permease [Deltaproteobacteria bacterium]